MSRKGKTCEVINLDTGEVFKSAKEASEKYFISYSCIYKCCTGKTKTSAGCRWAFTGNTVPKKSTARKVKNLDTGEVFDSIAEARNHFEIKYASQISLCCKHKAKSVYGYRWRYL